MIQIAHTSNIGYIYSGRVVAGIGMGMFSNVSPIYVAEIAPKEIRGRLTSIFQQLLVIGALIAYFLTYGVSLHWPSENKQWRLVRNSIMNMPHSHTSEGPRFPSCTGWSHAYRPSLDGRESTLAGSQKP
jgi:MFS family permease